MNSFELPANNAEKLAERLALIQLTPDEIKRLQQLHTRLENRDMDFLDDFYQYLRSFPAPRQHL
ncbi:MAG: hypothetical protein RQ715_00540, partial [Methylococcales bacterium]|nr:hypothetical protein [Methylococcales bacterium]